MFIRGVISSFHRGGGGEGSEQQLGSCGDGPFFAGIGNCPERQDRAEDGRQRHGREIACDGGGTADSDSNLPEVEERMAPEPERGAAHKTMRYCGRAAPTRNAVPRNRKIRPMSRMKCWLNGPVDVTPGTAKYQPSGE